jgi:hypothetical protein
MPETTEIKISIKELLEGIETLIVKDVDEIQISIKKTYSSKINKSEEFNFFDKILFFDHDNTQAHDATLYKETRGRRGVYVFVMKDECDDMKDFYLSHGAQHNNGDKPLKKGDTLYVGKSYKIGVRIREHHSANNVSPNSLKLNHETRKRLIGKYQIFCFLLKKDYHSTGDKKNMFQNLILGSVESFLHERLKPKVGSSRV